MYNIILLGLVSMLIDMSTEMVYPIIPLYLTQVLGATPVIVGIIEGIAESLSSLLKVFSGYISDKYKNKKTLTLIGYSGAVIYKIALIFASSWTGILLARMLDRIGKGIRVAPRDSLIAESAKDKKLGGSFGLHKMLDMLGSAAGILIAYLLITGNGMIEYRRIFILSLIPAILGILTIIFIKEKKEQIKEPTKITISFRLLDKRLKAFLITVFIFTLGNSSNAFLILRAQNSGFDTKTVILLYFLFNMVASLLAFPFGKLSDKVGRRKLLILGYTFYGFVYLGFAVFSSKTQMIVLFTMYGIYTALTCGAEKALVTEISPAGLKGTMLGMHSTLTGIALLPASVIAGLLWHNIGPQAPFFFGGILGLCAALTVSIILRIKIVKE